MSSDRIFVGREEELKAFREVLCAPQGQAVLITGPQGMGKTWLATGIADRGRQNERVQRTPLEVPKGAQCQST